MPNKPKIKSNSNSVFSALALASREQFLYLAKDKHTYVGAFILLLKQRFQIALQRPRDTVDLPGVIAWYKSASINLYVYHMAGGEVRFEIEVRSSLGSAFTISQREVSDPNLRAIIATHFRKIHENLQQDLEDVRIKEDNLRSSSERVWDALRTFTERAPSYPPASKGIKVSAKTR